MNEVLKVVIVIETEGGTVTARGGRGRVELSFNEQIFNFSK
jgi:hypothetical protein